MLSNHCSILLLGSYSCTDGKQVNKGRQPCTCFSGLCRLHSRLLLVSSFTSLQRVLSYTKCIYSIAGTADLSLASYTTHCRLSWPFETRKSAMICSCSRHTNSRQFAPSFLQQDQQVGIKCAEPTSTVRTAHIPMCM